MDLVEIVPMSDLPEAEQARWRAARAAADEIANRAAERPITDKELEYFQLGRYTMACENAIDRESEVEAYAQLGRPRVQARQTLSAIACHWNDVRQGRRGDKLHSVRLDVALHFDFSVSTLRNRLAEAKEMGIPVLR